ncbi:DUF2789 family protein [Marinomonas atlantica]|uniref:DUF2789 family protein n=1 Tax=Marinomonas atlantica TaxID=1806668 RepID=UPI00082A3090|nr:DUF2789 family protein [Marinomonas atlantica]MCO4786220.1 DUF2789 family protein [Marinomonas atlantica]
MEYQTHSLNELFQQLKLDDSQDGIERLVVDVAPVPSNKALWEAPEWTNEQAYKMQKLYEDEAQWSQAFEQLELLLRA